MRPFLFTLLLIVSLAGQSCGPTAQQVGQQVLIVAPLVLVLSSLAQWIILRLWPRRPRQIPTANRGAEPSVPADPYREPLPVGAIDRTAPPDSVLPPIPLRWRWRWNLVLAAVLALVAVVAFELGDRTEEVVLALWLFGCSYGTAVLVFTRVALQWARTYAFAAPQVAAIVVFVVPAAVMALGPGLFDDVAMPLFVDPGMGGSVTGGVFVALLIEAAIRRRLDARARAPASVRRRKPAQA